MPSAAAITVNDGKATPAAVTFAPESITTGESTFVDRTPGVSLAFRRLKLWFKPAAGASKVNRMTFFTDIPVTAQVNGVTSVVHTMRAKTEVIFADVSTVAERADLYAIHTNGLQHAAVKGSMRDLDPNY